MRIFAHNATVALPRWQHTIFAQTVLPFNGNLLGKLIVSHCFILPMLLQLLVLVSSLISAPSKSMIFVDILLGCIRLPPAASRLPLAALCSAISAAALHILTWVACHCSWKTFCSIYFCSHVASYLCTIFPSIVLYFPLLTHRSILCEACIHYFPFKYGNPKPIQQKHFMW